MTNPDGPIPCEHETGDGDARPLCGAPAQFATTAGPRCDEHAPARVGGRIPIDSPPVGKTFTGDDDSVLRDNLRDTPREALAAAWAAAPKNGTIEGKALKAHEWLTDHGWDVVDVREGPPVVLRPGEQVVHVPDGHVAEVVPTTPTISFADPELDTLAGIVTQLESLTPDARERVVDYLTDRYERIDPPDWVNVTPRTVSLSVHSPADRLVDAVRDHGPEDLR